ncbi:MAG: hypothetical protein ACJ8JD_09040 [Chthoniobacterales bacterium]
MNRLFQAAIPVSRAARLAALLFLAMAQIAFAERVATIQLVEPNSRLADVTANTVARNGVLKCALPQGDSTFIVSLPETVLLDRFDFVNENSDARGEVTVAVANYHLPAASPKWTNVDESVAFGHQRLFKLSLVGVEARYVKLSFRAEKAGIIAAQPIASSTAAQVFRGVADQDITIAGFDFAERLPRGKMIDLAKLRSNARIAELSSGDAHLATRMIDGALRTSFHFDPKDQRPFVIVELGDEARLNRVTAVYKSMRGRLDVYLLDDLSKSATDLNYRRPVASYVGDDADGNVAVDFSPEGARYVALRWTPLDPASFTDFEVAEIGAFGDVPIATLTEGQAPDLYAHNYTLPTITGDGGLDFSNKLGTLAEPPRLADVSP